MEDAVYSYVKTVFNRSFTPMQVQITENRNLTRLHVPELRRHEISRDKTKGDDDKDSSSVVISRPTPNRALVRFSPSLPELQRKLRSRHALQFVVQYDVDRSRDKAGEVQVR